MFSLVCTSINGWVNNREAGDLRCHRTYYNITVMRKWIWKCCQQNGDLFVSMCWCYPNMHLIKLLMYLPYFDVTHEYHGVPNHWQLGCFCFCFQQHFQANSNANTKALHHWSFVRESTGQQWIPLTKGQLCGNVSIPWVHHEMGYRQ